MKHWLILLSLLLAQSLLADLGGREGHGGDPYWYRFYNRAKFGLADMKKRQLVSPDLIKVYDEALTDLSFEITDDTLDTTGRVVDDPQRPGKQWVRLDRKKFTAFFDDKNQRKYLINFAVHEVFETKGKDLEKEITRNLLFSEDAYAKWILEQYEKEKGAGNGLVPSPSVLDDLSFAGLKQMFEDPTSKPAEKADLLGSDPLHAFAGRCVSNKQTDPTNALMTVLTTTDGNFKYLFGNDPEHGADWFDERFAKIISGAEAYSTAQSFTNAVTKDGSLLSSAPTMQMRLALRKHGDVYYLLQTSTQPDNHGERACLFFREVTKHNVFEAVDAQYDTHGPRMSLKQSDLLGSKDAFSLSLRCYNSTTYADHPTNGVLVGYRDEDSGLKIFVFMDPNLPVDTYDHASFTADDLKAVDWAKSVGFALATPDEFMSISTSPNNRMGYRVRRFDDYMVEGERCLGDNPDGSYEIVRLVNLKQENGALVAGDTAWACTSYYVDPPAPPTPAYDPYDDGTLHWRKRKNFSGWPPYYP